MRLAGPEAAIRHYLAAEGLALPPVAAFGIATPLDGDAVRMTNHPWAFSIEASETLPDALVERVAQLCEKYERPVASWQQARQILGLEAV